MQMFSTVLTGQKVTALSFSVLRKLIGGESFGPLPPRREAPALAKFAVHFHSSFHGATPSVDLYLFLPLHGRNGKRRVIAVRNITQPTKSTKFGPL